MADDVFRDRAEGGVPLRERLDFHRVSWGAIWAGVMVTIGMEALFLSFGIFIEAVLGGSAIWALAWYLITMIVSFYTGAWSAARLSDVSVHEVSVLHGLATWGLATLATLIIGLTIGIVAGWAALTQTAEPFSMAAFWGLAVEYGGVIWGGIFLSLIAAYMGGGKAIPVLGASAGETPTQMRRAS